VEKKEVREQVWQDLIEEIKNSFPRWLRTRMDYLKSFYFLRSNFSSLITEEQKEEIKKRLEYLQENEEKLFNDLTYALDKAIEKVIESEGKEETTKEKIKFFEESVSLS